jgi:hypothetical protein
MNLQDQVVYRCIHAQCGRLLPRRVNYCPYCGVSQRDGARAPVAPVEAAPAAAPAPVALDKPPQSQPQPQPQSVSPPPPASAGEAAAPSPPRGIPPPRMPAAPPQREPIRMRWRILGLIALWAIWMLTKPNKRDTEARIDNALALTRECKLGEAQGELIALRSGDATEVQLRRVQKAINDASPGCEKKRVRARSWTETQVAVDKLVGDGQIAKAHARLAQFTRRYGEDDETRALKERIGPVPQPARPRSTSPASGALARDVLSARRLIDQAERDIQAGNYQAASDKMETCVAMVEEGGRECAAFKVYADRLQAQMRQCLASGMEWVDRRCQ